MNQHKVGLTLGNKLKYHRLKNLLKICEKAEIEFEKRGLNPKDRKHLSLSVGLPFIEKASYQNDEVLQEKWVNFLVSSIDNTDSGFRSDLDITYHL